MSTWAISTNMPQKNNTINFKMKAGRLAVKRQPELLDEQPSPVA